MSIQELEAEVKRLPASELVLFRKWFEEFAAALSQDNGHSQWSTLSARGLSRAYGDSEPDYTLSDIKEQ